MAFPPSVRHAAIIRDQARCRHCGTTEREDELHVHHIVPAARDGNDSLGNAATLCTDCHYKTMGHLRYESERNKLLRDKIERLKSRDNVTKEEYDQLQEKYAQLEEEHHLMYTVLWEHAEPPAPTESDHSRSEGILSKLNPWE